MYVHDVFLVNIRLPSFPYKSSLEFHIEKLILYTVDFANRKRYEGLTSLGSTSGQGECAKYLKKFRSGIFWEGQFHSRALDEHAFILGDFDARQKSPIYFQLEFACE